MIESDGPRGARRSVAPAGWRELGPISVGLGVAAIEFAACGAILLALVVLARIPTGTAVEWAAMVLVPLSATIGFLGIRVGALGRSADRRSAGARVTELPEAV